MVTEYIAYNLLSRYGVDADVKHALDSFDFYIFPVINPDGTPTLSYYPSPSLTHSPVPW
jgi:murein tripeptide amidase MpaA